MENPREREADMTEITLVIYGDILFFMLLNMKDLGIIWMFNSGQLRTWCKMVHDLSKKRTHV